MKKALIILCLLISVTVSAQNEPAKPFRPSKGNFTVEVNFTPFSIQSPIGIDGFRGRYFLNEKLAVRTGFNIDYKKNKHEDPDIFNDVVYYVSTEEQYTTLGVNTGLEYHFLKAARFSPYIGLIVGYENKTSKNNFSDLTSSYYGVAVDEFEVTNGWMERTLYTSSGGYYYYSENLIERGYSQINANAVLGADFYVFHNFYLGLELGLGYNTYFYKEVTVNKNGSLQKTYPKATGSNIGLNYNDAIRLGFWF